jgi:hypothetical protein
MAQREERVTVTGTRRARLAALATVEARGTVPVAAGGGRREAVVAAGAADRLANAAQPTSVAANEATARSTFATRVTASRSETFGFVSVIVVLALASLAPVMSRRHALIVIVIVVVALHSTWRWFGVGRRNRGLVGHHRRGFRHRSFGGGSG